MDVDELLRKVGGETPLDRISSAMGVKRDLDELTDALIDHVVQEARDAGHSWSEIGAAMGVTKQAAQQRHRPEKREGSRRRLLDGAFTRFDDETKAAVAAAQTTAHRLGHGQIGTEHLLAGVLETSSVAADALHALGVTREVVVASLHADEPRRRRHLPFTRNAKKVLELALREALDAGASSVGCEHVVLAILRAEDSAAAKLLGAHGVTRATFSARAAA